MFQIYIFLYIVVSHLLSAHYIINGQFFTHFLPSGTDMCLHFSAAIANAELTAEKGPLPAKWGVSNKQGNNLIEKKGPITFSIGDMFFSERGLTMLLN